MDCLDKLDDYIDSLNQLEQDYLLDRYTMIVSQVHKMHGLRKMEDIELISLMSKDYKPQGQSFDLYKAILEAGYLVNGLRGVSPSDLMDFLIKCEKKYVRQIK